MFALRAENAGETARHLESLGFDGLWTTETPHDPYLPLVPAALATTAISVGTGIATAFTRSPMSTALTAWDLQNASDGRFVLGLGTQVKAHNARRYSTPVEKPGAQIRELIAALRHIWRVFQGNERLDFHGDFYTLDLFMPMHSPGAIDHPDIPIYVAAVGPFMYSLAGELADGVHVHSFHTPDYLREVALPALEKGLDKAGRNRDAVKLTSALFAVVGGDARMERAARSQIAFYGSTSSYQAIFDMHGWGDLPEKLKPLVRAGNIDAMADAIDDDVLAAFAVVADSWADVPAVLDKRYAGILDRIGFYGLQDMVRLEDAETIAAAFTQPAAL